MEEVAPQESEYNRNRARYSKEFSSGKFGVNTFGNPREGGFINNYDSYLRERVENCIEGCIDEFLGRFFTELHDSLYDSLYDKLSQSLKETCITKSEFQEFELFLQSLIIKTQTDSYRRIATIITENMVNIDETFNNRYITKNEYEKLELTLSSLKTDIRNDIQKNISDVTKEVNAITSKENHAINPMTLSIIVSSLIALTCGALSVYLFSVNNQNGFLFLYPSVVGIIITGFLINENLKKEGKYGDRKSSTT